MGAARFSSLPDTAGSSVRLQESRSPGVQLWWETTERSGELGTVRQVPGGQRLKEWKTGRYGLARGKRQKEEKKRQEAKQEARGKRG